MRLVESRAQLIKHARSACDADLHLLTVVACLDHQAGTMLLHAQTHKVHWPKW